MPVDPVVWVAEALLTPDEVDCATAVMLKILGGKCRMDAGEQGIMTRLYDALGGRAGHRLGEAYHRLIATARVARDEALIEVIYEQRVLAETMISRPVMKAFKQRLREIGVLPAQ